MTKLRRALTACALTTLVAGVTACGKSDDNSADVKPATAPATAKDKTNLKFIYVGNQSKASASVALLANGLKAGDETFGTTTEYRSPSNQSFDPNEVRRILESAFAQKPDGLIVNDFVPPQLNPTIKKFTDAGIPVVLSDAGLGEATNVGALTFIGSDQIVAGRMGADSLAKAGAKHALLITLQPGVPIIDMRTKGFQDGFKSKGKVTTVAMSVKDIFDSTKVRNVTKAELQKDKSIDAVFSTGGDCCAAAILAALDSVGQRAEGVHNGVIDLGKPQIEAIKAGKMDFALDHQPFLLGFQAVQTLALYKKYALRPGSAFLSVGPVAVNKDNVAAIDELNGKGIR